MTLERRPARVPASQPGLPRGRGGCCGITEGNRGLHCSFNITLQQKLQRFALSYSNALLPRSLSCGPSTQHSDAWVSLSQGPGLAQPGLSWGDATRHHAQLSSAPAGGPQGSSPRAASCERCAPPPPPPGHPHHSPPRSLLSLPSACRLGNSDSETLDQCVQGHPAYTWVIFEP